MTPKTQSVCKHCQQQIRECTATRIDSTGQCKGYIHTATEFHFCDRGVAEPASTGEPRLWRYPEDVALPVYGRVCLPVQKLAISANPEDHDLPWGIILEDRQTMYDVAELEFTGKAEAKVAWNADNYWFPRMWIEIFGELVINGKAATIAARPSEPSSKIGPWIHHKPDCAFATAKSIPIPECDCQPAPQTSAEPKCPKCRSSVVLRHGHVGAPFCGVQCPKCLPDGTWWINSAKDLSQFFTSAPQPVSGDAPKDVTSQNIFKYGARTGGYPCLVCHTTHDTNSGCPDSHLGAVRD